MFSSVSGSRIGSCPASNTMYYYGAARAERSEGKKKEDKKKHMEFRIQITVSIKETGTTENTFKRLLNYWDAKCAMHTPASSKENCKPLMVSPTATTAWGPGRSFWRYRRRMPLHSMAFHPTMSACAALLSGNAVSWEHVGPRLYNLYVAAVAPLGSLRLTALSHLWSAQEPQIPTSHKQSLILYSVLNTENRFFPVPISDSKGLGLMKMGNHSSLWMSQLARDWARITDKSLLLASKARACH